MKRKILLGSFFSVALFCVNSFFVFADVKKVLFVGDSITYVGIAEDYKWYGDYGMAASSESRDFAHLLYDKIAATQSVKPELYIDKEGGGSIFGKLNIISKLTSFGADLVIFQIGENDHDLTDEEFEEVYESLLLPLKKAASNVKMYCASGWKIYENDAIIKKVCERQGGVFIDVREIAEDPKNSASAVEGAFDDFWVNWHPGDAGMQAYADAFWNSMQFSITNCASETCQGVSCWDAASNDYIYGTKTEGCATVSATATPSSLTAPGTSYVKWSTVGGSIMEAACLSGPVIIKRGGWFLSDAECKESGLVTECTQDGYAFQFDSNQTGEEICTFYPYNSSDGKPGIPYELRITVNPGEAEMPTGREMSTCQPDDPSCDEHTCKDVHCFDGCENLQGLKDCKGKE
jgi:hypothetical protein